MYTLHDRDARTELCQVRPIQTYSNSKIVRPFKQLLSSIYFIGLAEAGPESGRFGPFRHPCKQYLIGCCKKLTTNSVFLCLYMSMMAYPSLKDSSLIPITIGTTILRSSLNSCLVQNSIIFIHIKVSSKFYILQLKLFPRTDQTDKKH